ncbi:MAG: hypothetical protein AB1393_03120 [Candidatus Edwardsbacteria bacterium]
MEEAHKQAMQSLVFSEGASLFGVADLTPIHHTFHTTIESIAKSLNFGVSIGFKLSDAIIDGIIDQPTLIYKHHYKSINYRLDQIALKCVAFIQEKGFRALPIPASQVVDWENQLGHLSHKIVGREAGLGWFGRSTLLVNPQLGARVRYVTILTDMPLKTDKPIKGDCEKCKACIVACPAKAISGEGYNKEKCLTKLKEFSKMPGIGQYICGVCVKVCKGGGNKNAKGKTQLDQRAAVCGRR